MTPSELGPITGEIDDWLGALPLYQAALLRTMLLHEDPDAVATRWLSASGAANTAKFGAASAGAALFYEKLLIEMKSLLCDDGYNDERARLAKGAASTRDVMVATVSMAVAPKLGAAAVFIAPAVALTLAMLARAGAAAACETLTSMIAVRASANVERADAEPR